MQGLLRVVKAQRVEDNSQTPEPTTGTYPYFDPKVWDRSGQTRDSMRVTQGEDDDEEEEDDDQEGRSTGTGEKSTLDWVELDDIDEEEYEENEENEEDNEDHEDNEDNEDVEDDKGDEDEDDMVDSSRGRHQEDSIVTADVSFYALS